MLRSRKGIVTVWLSPLLNLRLREQAAARGLSLSDVVRMALEETLPGFDDETDDVDAVA